MITVRLSRLAFAIACVLVACAGEPGDVAPVEPGMARYSLSWSHDGVSSRDVGWETSTDLGYTIYVERGYLVTYSVQFVQCTEYEAASRWERTWQRIRQSLRPVARAWAGHGDDADVSLVGGIVESLHRPVDQVFEATLDSEASYCNVHLLVARADEDVTERPDDVDLERVAVYVEGTWQLGEDEPVRFTVSGSAGFGRLYALEDLGMEGANPSSGFDIGFERQLSSLFDGVDFAGMEGDAATEDDIARTVVRRVIEDTVVVVR